MSLAKLTSLSTQTLSLLLERQRLQNLPSFPTAPSHLPHIVRNMDRLRNGILEIEAKEGPSDAVGLLRNQYERMRSMLGDDSAEVESLEKEVQDDVSSLSPSSPPTSLAPTLPLTLPPKEPEPEPLYSPYTDDPEAAYGESGIMLQTQQRMIAEQDEHLDRLAQSISRQHNISLQINDELDVHSGLLEELDTELDHTRHRMSNARRRLNAVARGAIANCSTVTIGILIFVLLILIIVFKT